MNFIKEFTVQEKLSFAYGVFLGLSLAFFFLVPVNTASAANQIYVYPTWNDIDQTNPDTKPNDAPDPSDRISYDGSDELSTAFQFCAELDYSYVSHLSDGTANPSAVWEPPEQHWEQKGNKDTFLQIICDDGSTGSTTDIVVDVQIDIPDYTDYIKYFLVFFTSIFFIMVAYYFRCLVIKFV